MKVGLLFTVCVLPRLAAQVSITSPPTLPAGVATVGYSFSFSASGGNQPYTWTVTSGPLPGTLNLSSGGVLSGTVSTSVVVGFTVKVTDSSAAPLSDTRGFSLTIVPNITTVSLPASTVNRPYPNTALTAAGLSGTPTWSAVNLPSGMSITAAGTLTGSPAVSGSFTPTFSVLDGGSGATGSAVLSLTINPAPAITDPSPLPSGSIASPYSYVFGTASPVSGGTPPYTWSTLSVLPQVLGLDSSGVLSGTPAQTGLFTFTIQATDSAGATGSKTFALVIGTLPVLVTTLRNPPASTAGVPYPPPPPAAQAPYFQASRGTGTYAWTASGLPGGLSVSPTTGSLAGITGTPSASGTFPVTVTATDPLNESDSATPTIVINPAPVINSDPPPQACTAGTACTRTLSLTGGTPGFTWALVSGGVPAGMSFSNTGTISGTPNAVASPTTSSFTVRVTDSATASNTQPLLLVVNPAIVISPSTLPATTSGISYSQTLTVTGGTGTITLTTTGLPAWLTLNNGVLSGTAPSVATPTSFPFSIRAADINNASATNLYTVIVNPLPSITSASPLPQWTIGRPYQQTITATGGTGAYAFADAGNTLPSWLSISTAGLLTGTPTATGTVGFTLKVTDSPGATGTKSFTLTINPAPSVTTTTLPATTSGIAYNQALSSTGGTAPLNWSQNGLPGWLTLSTTTGALTGTAPVVASATPYNFSVTVTDAAAAASAPQSLMVVVNPPVLITTSSPLPPTTSGLAYSQQITASGGTGSIGFSSSNLPGWLTLSAAGALTGTPAVVVQTTYTFNVTATDAVGALNTKSFSVTVNPAPNITSGSPLPQWTVNRPYVQTIIATGGTGALVFTDNGSTLPAWLAISPAGILAGTPTATGTASFTLRVTDSLGAFATRTFALTINPTPSVITTSLPPAGSGAAYSQPLAETGGTPAFAWQGFGLPAWLTLAPGTGVLTGTAPVVTTPTPFSFAVTVTDAAGAASAPQSLTLMVNPALTITTSNPLPPTESSLSYSITLTTAGGAGSVTWSGTNLPTWLSLSAAGVLSGTAPAVPSATPYSFTVSATDSVVGPASKALSVTVYPAVAIATTSPLPPWTVNRPYAQTIAATAGLSPYTFADAGATLPAWLAITAAGALTGTPSASGTFNFSLRVTDGLGGTATKAFALTINPAPSVTTTSLPATTSGRPYNQTLTATGGTPSLTFAAQGLPTWLTLSGANLTGTAPATGASIPFNFTVTASDSTGAVSPPQALSVTVNPAVAITTGNPLPPASSNAFYSQTFAASGGTGSISWSFAGLPPWLVPSGATVSGTAPAETQSTSFPFSATATDTVGSSNTRSFTVTVVPGVVITNSPALGPWTATRPFSVTLTAAGGTPPYRFQDPNTTLPSWLPLAGNLLSGTPPAAGTFPFTILATDSLGATGSANFTLLINPLPSVTTTSLPPTTSGLAYSQGLAAAGGTGTLVWGSPSLPGWLAFNGFGLVGTAPAVSAVTQYPFPASVTDSTGASSAPQPLSVTVNPPVTITTSPPLPQAVVQTPYSVSFTATGGTGGINWNFSGVLPSWLTVTGNTISGTPPASAASSAANFIARATDTLGAFDSREFQLVVGTGAPIITGTLPAWTVNRPYSAALTASGGVQPYSQWTVAAGSLPDGLRLDSNTGAVTGMPTAVGTASFTVSVTDASGRTGSAPYTLPINPVPVIPPQTLPAAAPASAYSQPLSETGGTAQFTWSAAGLANTGFTVTSSGLLTGVPTLTPPATIDFTASLRDAAGATASQALSLTVAPGITITTGPLPATTSTAAYSASLTATGGTGAITFSAPPNSLPPGIALSSQGVFSGTAPVVPAPRNFTFTVTATDSLGIAATKSFSILVNPIPRVLTVTLPAGTAGAPYSFQLRASGGTGALVWSAQGLPLWASLNPSSGVISGTPPAVGTATLAAIATDTLAVASPPAPLALAVNAPGGLPSITTPCPLPTTTAGLQVSRALTATGGFPPYSWSATGLPGWLSSSASGTLSGTAVEGTEVFTLQATDSHSQVATLGCGITVNALPAVITTSLAPGTAGAPYAQTLSAAGGTGALTWSATVLPPWFALDPQTGALRGTPPAPGTFGLSVLVRDSLGVASAPASLAVSVTGPGGSPVITACPLPSGATGSPMSFQLTAALGFPPYSWAVASLPDGLAATADGAVSGTPSGAGSFSVSLTVTDAANLTTSTTCPMNISPGPTVTTTSLPGGTVGAPYAQPLAASGGVGALRWSGTGIPTWLSLDPATGVLGGTPAAAGSYAFSVQVSDTLGNISPAAPLSIAVTPGGLVNVTTACPLPDLTESILLAATFTAVGGTPPYSWTASGLPAGVSLSPGGGLSGAPTAGTITFSVQATDQQRQTASKNCSLRVNPRPAITTTGLPDAVAGTPYSASVGATGGTGRLTWSGGLPYWLSIDPASGALSGTPPSAGGAGASVRVSDALNVAASKSFSFSIAVQGSSGGTSPMPALTSACPLPGATAGVSYSQAQTAAGGAPPYQFFVSGLPAGMTYSSNGAITGTAQSGGTTQVVVQVIDSKGTAATATCELTIAPPLPLQVALSTPDGKVNQTYSGAFMASGGVGPFTWSVISGSLPPGIQLDSSTGLLTGVPAAAGSYTFQAQATDFSQTSVTASGTINIAATLLITTPPSLPDATGGNSYRQALAVASAAGAVAWSLVSGALPSGLNLDPAGLISGAATQAGAFSFTLQATDAAGQIAQQKFALNVNLAPLPQMTITGLASPVPPNQQLTANVSLASPYPLEIVGQLNLTVTADPSIGVVDPAVQFASGGGSVSFRIPANSTQVTFAQPPSFQTGTVAGNLKLDVALQSGGVAAATPSSPAISGQIPKLAPVIVGTPTAVRNAGGVQVTVIGFATSREVTAAAFHFAGTNVQNADLTVSLGSLLGGWFNDPQSAAYGSTFKLVQQFTVQGAATQVTAVTVTLTNSVGSSTPVTVTF